MGSLLGPTLANIIMAEFENIIKPLINNGTIAFYKRYVEDTIVLAKPCDLDRILKQFNSFHPQIQFTIQERIHMHQWKKYRKKKQTLIQSPG